MRLLLLVGLFAAILILLTAGCGRNGATWTEIREVSPPSIPRVGAVRTSQAAKPLAVGHAIGGKHNNGLMSAHPVADEIAQNIADNHTYWSEYQSGLCKQPRIFESGIKAPAETAQGPPPPLIPAPEINLAVRQKYRDQFVNLQLRIAVLESRIAAGGEAGSRDLAAKLEDAREQLRSLNALCIAESNALPK